MKPRLVFSPRYSVDYGWHSFAAEKFGRAADLLGDACARVAPSMPPREDLLLAHDAVWADKVVSGRLSPEELKLLELPFSPEIAPAHVLSVAGTILAARHALETGVGLHCGGGAHHAFRDRGEGYCALNDIASTILKLLGEGKIARAAVVDLDVHQGNGTASILAEEPRAFTFSMHQGDLYPEKKEKSSLDVELPAGLGDAEYYDRLKRNLRAVMDFKPDLVIYQAGADVWEKDRLGGLKLTERGVLERDTAVLETCRLHRVPVAVVLGGGYGPTPADTARLHARTLACFGGLKDKVPL
ncbi:MAG: histone deacetylase [Elusimicrobia bacterium]|nr:histone deacetylase [Elusimicrobiota bacterium]